MLFCQSDWCHLFKVFYHFWQLYMCVIHIIFCTTAQPLNVVSSIITQTQPATISQRLILLSSLLKLQAGISRLVAFFNPLSQKLLLALRGSVQAENKRLLCMLEMWEQHLSGHWRNFSAHSRWTDDLWNRDKTTVLF